MEIRCWSCKEEKNETEFHRHSKSKTGRQSRCKVCEKEWHAKRYLKDKDRINFLSCKWRKDNKERSEAKSKEWKLKNPDKAKLYQRISNLRSGFGLEIHEYDKMFEMQKGVCAICGKPETFIHHRTKQLAMLAVDHCHSTGKVRGLLCKNCNTAIGLLGDNHLSVLKASEYLEKHNGG